MDNEKITALTLALMVAGVLSVYLAYQHFDEISDNLNDKVSEDLSKTVEYGDCVDVHYVLKYASNGTFIESSYEDVLNRSGGSPLRVFVSLNESEAPPDEYVMNYSSGMIDGFLEGLVGLEEGETATIELSPEDAYGLKVIKGLKFNTLWLLPLFNTSLEVTNMTAEKLMLKWVDLPEENFTMPQGIIKENPSFEDVIYGSNYETLPPYYLWENSSKIINSSSSEVKIETIPTKLENISEQILSLQLDEKIWILLPNCTTAEVNGTEITINTSPQEGYSYSLNYYNTVYNLYIANVTDEHINITISNSQGSQNVVYNRTLNFDTIYTIPRDYNISLDVKGVPYVYNAFGGDVQRTGYSLHKLAGESLTYEVTIEKVIKTSQD